jgi:hypothetical protein
MTSEQSRQILLALMEPFSFGHVARVTEAVAAGRPVQVNYGFRPEEIRRARGDRAMIAEEYRKHYSAGLDSLSAGLKAKFHFLGMLHPEGGEG